MKKKIIIILLAIIAAITIGYNYIYKEARNISKETPEFIISSSTLKDELISNQDLVVKKYLDKTIQVSGEISHVDKNFVILDGYITTQITSIKAPLNIGEKIVIKGRFIGYDELLEELKLDQCTIINKQ